MDAAKKWGIFSGVLFLVALFILNSLQISVNIIGYIPAHITEFVVRKFLGGFSFSYFALYFLMEFVLLFLEGYLIGFIAYKLVKWVIK